jgi:hypothetical protein
LLAIAAISEASNYIPTKSAPQLLESNYDNCLESNYRGQGETHAPKLIVSQQHHLGLATNCYYLFAACLSTVFSRAGDYVPTRWACQAPSAAKSFLSDEIRHRAQLIVGMERRGARRRGNVSWEVLAPS